MTASSSPSAPTERDCPLCEGKGWYVEANRGTGEPEQVQCEFCLATGKLYVGAVARGAFPAGPEPTVVNPSSGVVMPMRQAWQWACVRVEFLEAVLRGEPTAVESWRAETGAARVPLRSPEVELPEWPKPKGHYKDGR